MSEQPGNQGMSAATARTVEYAIIALCVIPLLLLLKKGRQGAAVPAAAE